MSRARDIQRVDLAARGARSFVRHGDRAGPVVLLLHAWGESLRSFDRLVPLLPSSFDVVAFDQRGHGSSDRPDAGYDVESLAADVTAFLDALGLGQAVMVGSSSGGYVAQQVAVRAPERLSGLVLIGSPHSLLGRTPFTDEVERLVDPVDPEWVRAFIGSFALAGEVPDWYLADRVEESARIPAGVWKRSLAGLVTSPPPIETGLISAPTLIIWGDHDDLLPRAGQLYLAGRIPGATLREYEGVGHLVLWEQPERVAADLASFVLAGIAAASADLRGPGGPW